VGRGGDAPLAPPGAGPGDAVDERARQGRRGSDRQHRSSAAASKLLAHAALPARRERRPAQRHLAGGHARHLPRRAVALRHEAGAVFYERGDFRALRRSASTSCSCRRFGLRDARADYDTIYTRAVWRGEALESFRARRRRQYLYEPRVPGNRFAPYRTPASPTATTCAAKSRRRGSRSTPAARTSSRRRSRRRALLESVGYVGFGKLGPLLWNNFYVNHLRRHPERSRVRPSTERLRDLPRRPHRRALPDQRGNEARSQNPQDSVV